MFSFLASSPPVPLECFSLSFRAERAFLHLIFSQSVEMVRIVAFWNSSVKKMFVGCLFVLFAAILRPILAYFLKSCSSWRAEKYPIMHLNSTMHRFQTVGISRFQLLVISKDAIELTSRQEVRFRQTFFKIN